MRTRIMNQYEDTNARIVKDFMPDHKGNLFGDVIPKDKDGIEELDMKKVRKYIRKLEDILESKLILQ